MERQSWWQTISLIITILGMGAFIWLNAPTNDDLRDLKDDLKNDLRKSPTREEMNARFDKLEAIMTIVGDEVKGIKSDLQVHTQNYDAHVVKQNRR